MSLTLAAAVCESPTSADGQPSQDPVGPPGAIPVFQSEIIVTPERHPEARDRVPAATSVLTRENLEEPPAATLPEVLELLPGVQVLFRHGLGGAPIVSSRGFFGGGEAEYVRLLIDGIPLADVESGLSDWGSLQAAEIERIEALRGPGSAVYGDTAIGGVVHVFTRRSRDRGGRAAVAGGTSATVLANGAYHLPFRSFVLSFAGNGSRTAGFRENASASQGALYTSFDGTAGESRWRIEASALTRDRRDPGPLTATELAADRFGSNPDFRFDRENTDKVRGGVTYQRTVGSSHSQLRADALARRTNVLRTVLIAPGFGDRTARSLFTLGGSASVEAGRSVAFIGSTELQINSGLEVSHERLETDYRPVSNSGHSGAIVASADPMRRRAGAFASVGWAASRRLRLSSGVRWDYITYRSGDERSEPVHRAWSPRVGVSMLAGPLDQRPVSLFIQAARAFKAPTLDQLFDPHPFPDFLGGTFQISHDRLEPQRALNVEVGASQVLRNFRWEVTAYRMPVRNEIDFDPATFKYGNIGRTRHSGVELAWRLFDGAAVSPELSYTWTRVAPLSGPTRGLQLKNIPEHTLRPAVSVALPGAVRINVRVRHIAGRYMDDEHEFALRDASVAEMRIEKRIAGSRLTLDLLNVGATRVEELGFVLPGASGARVGYYFPGAGFAARAALAVEF